MGYRVNSSGRPSSKKHLRKASLSSTALFRTACTRAISISWLLRRRRVTRCQLSKGGKITKRETAGWFRFGDPKRFASPDRQMLGAQRGRAPGSQSGGQGFDPPKVHHVGRLAICRSAFLCRDIYNRRFVAALLLTFCGHRSEVLKGNIKLDFQCVVPINIDGLDKLGNNHLLRVECAGIV